MTQNKKTKIFNAKGGCNEDCFNCPFPDCYKPTNLIKNNEELHLFRAIGESQGKMYTVMLGGYGGARPNLSKKYLRSTLW